VIIQNKNKLPLNNRSRFLPGNNILILVGVLTLGLILAIYFGVSIGRGDYYETYLVILMLVTPAVLFFLKSNYWLLIPFVIRCGLPAIPLIAGKSIALKEIWVVVCVVMLFGQLFFYRSRQVRLFRIELIPIYLIMSWVVAMFFREGIGLAILGSSAQGGRKYLGIILACLSMVVIFHQKVSEKQCKWLIILIVSSVGTAMIWSLVNYFFFRRVDYETEQWATTYYSYHQILASLPLVLIIWLFSKYSPAEIIVRVQISVMAMLGICYGVIVYSGKRMHLALALVIPFIAALIRRQYGAVMLFGGGGAIALALLVVGQGNFFVLPLSAQRAMSFIPGMKVDAVIEDQSQTNFRTTLRQISLEKIAQHPIIGNGLSVSEGEIIELEAMQEYAVEETDSHAYKMAAGSAWHNTWLGISTDFGIPCAVVFAVFWFQIFKYCVHLRRRLPIGSYAYILVTMLLIMNIGDLLQSWVAGHSLEDVLWVRGWQFAVLWALKIQLQEQNHEEHEPDQAMAG
jgi:hypothetical protein